MHNPLDAKVIPQLSALEDHVFGPVSPIGAPIMGDEAEPQDESKRQSVAHPALPPQYILVSLLENQAWGVRKIRGYCFVRLPTKSGIYRASQDAYLFEFALDAVRYEKRQYGKCSDIYSKRVWLKCVRREDSPEPDGGRCSHCYACISGARMFSGLQIWRYDERSGLLTLNGMKFHFRLCEEVPAPIRVRREDTTPPPPRPCEGSGSGEGEWTTVNGWTSGWVGKRFSGRARKSHGECRSEVRDVAFGGQRSTVSLDALRNKSLELNCFYDWVCVYFMSPIFHLDSVCVNPSFYQPPQALMRPATCAPAVHAAGRSKKDEDRRDKVAFSYSKEYLKISTEKFLYSTKGQCVVVRPIFNMCVFGSLRST